MRVHQWIKNIFIFIPLFFSGNFFNFPLLKISLVSFFIFSLVASCIYVINDIVDKEKDALHPKKKYRPLPSGQISVNQSIFLFFSLLLTSFGLVYFLNINTKVILLLVGYFILNLAYSFKLKQIPIIDITVISLGFLIRVLVGGYATGVFVSRWTILLTFLLALIMAIGKRRGELIEVKLGGVTRKSLNGYSVEMLDMSFSIIASVSIVCYIMYTFSNEAITTFKDAHDLLYLSVIFLVVSILRYVQQTVIFNRTESPTKVLYKDKFLQFIIFSWSIFFLMLLYYNSLKQIFLHLLSAI